MKMVWQFKVDSWIIDWVHLSPDRSVELVEILLPIALVILAILNWPKRYFTLLSLTIYTSCCLFLADLAAG